ncbi:hypothetical protein ACFLT0_00830 [Chloroflexota bacterium]
MTIVLLCSIRWMLPRVLVVAESVALDVGITVAEVLILSDMSGRKGEDASHGVAHERSTSSHIVSKF